MNCYECGGVYQEKFDLLEVLDPYVGNISIQGIPYYQCDKCEDILYTEEMSRAIETKRNQRIHQLLSQFPISDFITAIQTASILGISRQALHKNRRINNGFIHQTIFGGASVYLRKSVLKFKNTGDGRFPLYLHSRNYVPKYAREFIHRQWTNYRYLQQVSTFEYTPKSVNIFKSEKEYSYGK